jgi:ribosomal-protein-alanine N-acetyltransferase
MMLTWFARDDTPMLTGSRVILRAPRAGDYTAWRDLRRSSR